MAKEIKGQKGLPDFVLVRYYRHVSAADHVKRAGLPVSYVQQDSMWTVLGAARDPRFRRANYIGLSVGEVLGQGREVAEKKPEKKEEAEKPAKKGAREPAGKPVRKNGKRPSLKIKNSEGKVVGVV